MMLRVFATALAAIGAGTSPRRGADFFMQHDDIDVPSLRYLGDAKLMASQPPLELVQLGSDELKIKLTMLRKAMELYGGIGIAAPQVGWWTRVFCFGIDDGNPRYPAAEAIPFSIWINPEIDTSDCEATNWMWEGCLSVPGVRGWVERPVECVLRGLDEHGTPRELRLTGLAARIAQHEYDHLDGVLFPQRTPGVGFVVPQASFGDKDTWAEDWPSEGSRRTALGELSSLP
jgi:peptide deformylase